MAPEDKRIFGGNPEVGSFDNLQHCVRLRPVHAGRSRGRIISWFEISLGWTLGFFGRPWTAFEAM